jgi:hypothetical protein
MPRAKFICDSVTKRVQISWSSGEQSPSKKAVYSYKFSAVVSGSEENKQFFSATPHGELELSALRDDLFEVGEQYYLDFTPANQGN